jgi:hypothetical protein
VVVVCSAGDKNECFLRDEIKRSLKPVANAIISPLLVLLAGWLWQLLA